MTILVVVLGAAVGAPLRYLTDRLVQGWHESQFPWGTWCVNVAGSFLLGLLAAGAEANAVSDRTMTLLGVGFCGALTTYSTFGYETLRLVERQAWLPAAAYVVGSVVAGVAAAFGGATVGAAIWR